MTNKKLPRVLSLFDFTGEMVKPWLRRGFPCTIVDLRHPKGVSTDGLLTKVGADVSTWIPPMDTYGIVFAFPPCTHLAVSGARWFQGKGLAGLIEGLSLVERSRQIAEWSRAAWMIENPVGTISTYWRKPDFRFDPCDYAGYLKRPDRDAYTKKTCLWTSSDFVMPKPKRVHPHKGSMFHYTSPSADRGNIRSVTPRGFARAVYLANAPFVGITRHG